MDRFGYLDGSQKHSVTPQPNNKGAAVIEKTSEDSAVLLRDENHALPLTSKDLASLALIGPTAGQVDAIGLFSERSGGLPERQTGPLEALRHLAPEARITYAVDDDMTGTPIPANHLSHEGHPGLVRNTAGVDTVDQELNFTSSNARALPPNSSAVWSGSISVDHDGEYWIYLQVLGGRGRLLIDGRLVSRTGATAGGMHGNTQQAGQDNGMPTLDGLDSVRHSVHLPHGQHPIRVELTPDGSGNPVQVRLNWMSPGARIADHEAAIKVARAAKTVVVFVWSRESPYSVCPVIRTG
ncbi:MAG: glycoside hydrolase family 3 C-terminal domain-containing protein [Edaphobacter sp.]